MQQESVIRKILKSEVSTVIAVVLATVGFVGWLTSTPNQNRELIVEIQKQQAMTAKDIEVINTNHLAHIQASITKLEQQSDQNIKDHSEIDKKLERILTILEEK